MKGKTDFKQIKELNWEPYVGKNYFKNEKRILIIGESHYETSDNREKYKDKNFTKSVIENHAINGLKYSKLFPNLHRTLFAELKFDRRNDRRKLWDHLAFYNFVQRSMESNKKRPSKEDFENGWQTFFKVIEALRPTHCLFIGVGAFKTMPTDGIPHIDILKFPKGGKVGRTYPRKFILKIKPDIVIIGILIQHTSRYFSLSKWNDYLEKEIKEELIWLKQKIQ